MVTQKRIKPKTITGAAAEGEYFFNREYINQEFWDEISKGNHILFTAPRRVGKTSVMKYLVANNNPEYLCFYENIESIKDSKTFYKRFFEILLRLLNSKRKITTKLLIWIKTKEIEDLSLDGKIKIKHKNFDYKEALFDLIKELKNLDQKVVIFLDEFPEIVRNIAKKEGNEQSKEILHDIREIRHNQDFKNIRLVLAGSIGLEHVVEEIDRPKLINDLHTIKIAALSTTEAYEFINQIIEGASIQISNEIKECIFSKLNFNLVPFFIQVMLEKCEWLLSREARTELTTDDVDSAFQKCIIDYDSKFSDWQKRLESYLSKDESRYCIFILTKCAIENKINVLELYDVSKKYKVTKNYMRLISMLEKDGYLSQSGNDYSFVSPLLQAWWKKMNPVLK